MNAFAAMVITAQRLVLIPLRQVDADAMVDVLADQQLHEFIGGRPASRAELHERYGRLAAGSPDPDQLWLNWIIRRRTDRTAVGTMQATVARGPDGWTAEVAWVVGVPWIWLTFRRRDCPGSPTVHCVESAVSAAVVAGVEQAVDPEAGQPGDEE